MKSIVLSLSIAAMMFSTGLASAEQGKKAPPSSPPAATAPAKPPTEAPPSPEMVKRVAAANELLSALNMDKLMSESIEQMLNLQVQQNPKIAPYKVEMRKFFAKHLAWNSLKGEFVKMYADEFTEKELKDLTAFYKTPTGLKALQKMPGLMAKGAQIGQKRVEDNRSELEAIVREAEKQKNKTKR